MDYDKLVDEWFRERRLDTALAIIDYSRQIDAAKAGTDGAAQT